MRHFRLGVGAPWDEQVGLLVLVAQEHVPDRHPRLKVFVHVVVVVAVCHRRGHCSCGGDFARDRRGYIGMCCDSRCRFCPYTLHHFFRATRPDRAGMPRRTLRRVIRGLGERNVRRQSEKKREQVAEGIHLPVSGVRELVGGRAISARVDVGRGSPANRGSQARYETDGTKGRFGHEQSY